MLFINPLMNDDIQLNFRYSSIYFNSLYIRSLARLSFFLTSYARTRYVIRCVNRPFYRCNNGMTVGGNLSPSI